MIISYDLSDLNVRSRGGIRCGEIRCLSFLGIKGLHLACHKQWYTFQLKGVMLKAKTKEITMASQNRKKILHQGKEIPKLNQANFLRGGGKAEIGEYSLVGKEFSFSCDWLEM